MNFLNKLQYDSFYKFIISLGIIIFFVPIFLFFFLITNQNKLIEHIDNLSTPSSLIIQKENAILLFYVNHIVFILIIAFIISSILMLYGLIKWWQLQKQLDEQIFLTTKSQSLGIQLQEKEIKNKILDEVKEDKQIANKNIKTINDSNQSRIHALMEKIRRIETLFLEYLSKQYPTYHFEQNIMIGASVYDIIGNSKTTNIDNIYEIKYLKQIPSENIIKNIVNRINRMRYEYETIRHRNCMPILIIVSQNKLPVNIKQKILSVHGIVTYFFEEKEVLSNNIKINI